MNRQATNHANNQSRKGVVSSSNPQPRWYVGGGKPRSVPNWNVTNVRSYDTTITYFDVHDVYYDNRDVKGTDADSNTNTFSLK